MSFIVKGWQIDVSEMNPLKFTQENLIGYNPDTTTFQKLYQSTKFARFKYVQKYAINDWLKVQIVKTLIEDLNFEVIITAKLIDLNGLQYGPDLELIEKTGTWDSSITVYEIEKQLTSSYQGTWIVQIDYEIIKQKLIDPITVNISHISEPINIQYHNQFLPLIEYRNTKNLVENFMFYEINGETKPYQLRAELFNDWIPKLEIEEYREQMGHSLVDSQRYRVIKLSNSKLIAGWICQKLAWALSHDELYYNGLEVSIVSIEDPQPVMSGSYGFSFSAVITEKDNILSQRICFDEILKRE